MGNTIKFLILAASWFLLALAISGPAKTAAAEPTCGPPPPTDAGNPWLADKPIIGTARPPSHAEGGGDCPFYSNAWQRFLLVTQPDKTTGRPAFLAYASPDDLFDQPKPKPTCPDGPVLTGGVFQAKSHGILIDRLGHPVYYDIRADPGFQAFLAAKGLHTTGDLQHGIKPDWRFAPGAIELKSAWQIVDPKAPPSNYFITKACVPKLIIDKGQVVASTQVVPVTVALLALHVVFTLDDHPEFIWSTFEHVGSSGERDNAPAAKSNPSQTAGDTPVSGTDAPLYAANTPPSKANTALTPADYAAHFDVATQTFDVSTPVYRLYPGSKTDADPAADQDVVDLDNAMGTLFTAAKLPAADKRKFYQLVGAIWLDNGAALAAGQSFDLGENESTEHGVLAGEGRLSSTAMESFTQGVSGFPNCFSCHNTQIIKTDVKPFKLLMAPNAMNVSHFMSKYLSDQSP